MEAIPKSGYYYPNKFALIMFKALEDVMGKNGLDSIINLAKLGVLSITIRLTIWIKNLTSLIFLPST